MMVLDVAAMGVVMMRMSERGIFLLFHSLELLCLSLRDQVQTNVAI